MLAIDPDNTIALNNLSITLWDMRQYAEAESLAVRCMNTGIFSNCPFHAIRAQIAQGKIAAADSTLARWQHALPNDPNLGWTRFGLAGYRGDYAAAERLARELQAAQPGVPPTGRQSSESDSRRWPRRRAKLRAGGGACRAAQATAEARGLPADYLSIAAVDRRAPGARSRIDLRRPPRSCPRRSRSIRWHRWIRATAPTLPLARALRGGRPRGRRAAPHGEYSRTVPAGLQKADASWSLGVRRHRVGAGSLRRSDRLLSEGAQENGGPNLGLFDIAVEYQKLGQPDSARVYFEESLAHGGPLRVVFADPFELAATYQRLGEIYEAKGDRKKAIEYYLKLTDLWKNADPELQPIVKDAHARIARLSAEH